MLLKSDNVTYRTVPLTFLLYLILEIITCTMLYVFIILSLYIEQIQNKANMGDNRLTLYIRGYFTDF